MAWQLGKIDTRPYRRVTALASNLQSSNLTLKLEQESARPFLYASKPAGPFS
jgi:hypothetical protein